MRIETIINQPYPSTNQPNPFDSVIACMDTIINADPQGIITTQKIKQWQEIENSFDDSDIKTFIEFLFTLSNTNNFHYYLVLINDKPLTIKAVKIFVEHEAFNTIDGVDTLLQKLSQCSDLNVPFILRLLKQGPEKFVDNFLLAQFNQLSPESALFLFQHMNQSDRTTILKSFSRQTDFLATLLTNFTRSTQNEIKIVSFFINTLVARSKNPEGYLNQFLRCLIRSKSVAIPYLHMALPMNIHWLYLTGDPLADDFVHLTWSGSLQQKRNLVLQMEEKPCATPLLNYSINFSTIHDEELKMTLPDFFSIYQDATQETLAIESCKIQKIPPIVIALTMATSHTEQNMALNEDNPWIEMDVNPTASLIQNWLISLLPYFTVEQIEACALFFPFPISEEQLREYERTLENHSYVSLLHGLSIHTNLEAYLNSSIATIQNTYSALNAEISNWKVLLERCYNHLHAHGNMSAEELNELHVGGNKLKHQILVFGNHPLRRFLDSKPIVSLNFNNMEQNYANINRLLMKLPPIVNTDDENLETLSEGYLLKLTQKTLTLLEINNQEELEELGFKTDADFIKIGLSFENLQKVEEFGNLLRKFRISTTTPRLWSEFLNNDCLEGNIYTIPLDKLVKALTAKYNTNKLKLLKKYDAFIKENFPQYIEQVDAFTTQMESSAQRRKNIEAKMRFYLGIFRENQFEIKLYREIQKRRESQKMVIQDPMDLEL